MTVGANAPIGDVERAAAQAAALEQLLAVYEEASVEQNKRLEESLAGLAESDQRLRLALESGRMGTWEWDILNARVLWSPQLERLYGLAEGTFAGTLDAYRECIHPDDRDESLRRAQDALARHADAHHIVHRILRPDGEVRWLDSHGRFVYADDGRPLRLVGVSADVTERRAVEVARDRALAEAEFERHRLLEIFRQAPAAIAVTRGPAHHFVSANPLFEHLAGRVVVGQAVRDAMPELESQGFVALLDQVYESGQAFVGNEVPARVSPDDRLDERFFNFVYQPLAESDGAVTGIMIHAVDVTEQVRARQNVEGKADELARLSHALSESNRELDQFAYVASHDLKAPLRGIANLATWIEEDSKAQLSDDSRQHLRLMLGRVHRMEALIDGILHISRAGRARGTAEPVALGDLVREIIDLLDLPAGVTIVVDGDLPTLEAERVPLQQVLMNLINNAVKHARRSDARVEISARDDGAFCLIAVRDNGPGIAAEYHERIWQLFQTLEARDTVEGTGIGLSVVKKIVESRGGRVDVESELGHGATFLVWWPTHSRTEG
ncbi:MAG: ATP-binding protein [Gemmatimonadaceae bacterium]